MRVSVFALQAVLLMQFLCRGEIGKTFTAVIRFFPPAWQ